jgi:hypothetical protein
MVLAANTARSLFAMSFLGTGLIFLLYFQQVLGAAPMKAGVGGHGKLPSDGHLSARWRS